jgi:hypothetical protein
MQKILMLSKHVDGDSLSMQLGKKSLMTGFLSESTFAQLAMMSRSVVQTDDACNEIHRVRSVMYLAYLSLKLIGRSKI